MLSVIAVLTLIVAVLYWYKRPHRFPNGPRGLPIFGISLFIGKKNLAKVLHEYQKDYGKIFSVRIGREDAVVLNNFEDISDALVRKGSVFSGRPQSEFLKQKTYGKGVGFIDYGHVWKVQRKFGTNTLRGFGVGTQSFEAKIEEELFYLTEELMKRASGPFDPTDLISNAVSNVICNVVYGKRFEYKDKDFKKILQTLSNCFNGEQAKYWNVLQFAFWMRHLPLVRNAYRAYQHDFEFVIKTILKIAEEHFQTYDEKNCRDFIDAFIKETKNETDPSFEFEQLAQYIRDLFEAGTETTSSSLSWCILALLWYPAHKIKIYSEIEHVIGRENPSMKHMQDMPYTRAFILEILRHRTIAPLALMHKTNAPVEFRGFVFPKDTTIITNLWAVHRDPGLFKLPEEFNPSRFIDPDGKFIADPHVIAFSVGPRQCLGIKLAKMELFMILTKLIQQFDILAPSNDHLPSFHDGKYGFTYIAKPYKAKFKPRK